MLVKSIVLICEGLSCQKGKQSTCEK